MGKGYDLSLVCTSCKRGVQENGAIGLVILQTAKVNYMFCNTFPMRDN